jgi:hypothetical protein
VPDISSLLKPGERAEVHQRGETIRKGQNQAMDGVTGLKQLGVRELNYKLIFSAQYSSVVSSQLNMEENLANNELDELNEQNIQKYSKIFK